ncbi:MAG: LacI family DNA-binding transcriptional regulator [Planctomycetota bacterium]|jgi:DNA-binding LacI/PurR family transcriptional regulator|nr:LacI family DNA-binding transcriptional regulator [Planctomycetota bacterium]
MPAKPSSSPRITAATVAKACGVSATTVREILGDRGGRYREDTRSLVIDTARKIGYQPNGAARAMARGRYRTLGLVYAGHGSAETFGSGVLEGVAAETQHLDLKLLFASVAKADTEGLPPVFEGCMDGLLVMPGAGGTAQNYLIGSGPCVLLNQKRRYDAVYPNECAAAARATRMLLRSGCRSVVQVRPGGQGGHFSLDDRRQGYLDAMQAAGLEPVLHEPHAGQAVEDSIADLVQMLAQMPRPFGVVANDVRTAVSVYEAARQTSGLRVPEDLRLVTFGSDMTGMLAALPMAVLFTPQNTVGIEAVRMLEQRIAETNKRQPARAVGYDPAWDFINPRLAAVGIASDDAVASAGERNA